MASCWPPCATRGSGRACARPPCACVHPEDASSARFGQSVYQFLPHAYKYNFLNAWRLEAVRLRKKGLPVFGWQNELIWWYLLSLALLVGFGWAFGWLGMVFFLGQAFVAVTLLEIINYVEHYGLHRRKGEDGRYERTNHTHSWNSNFVFTNLVLFHLQRHSDHHAFAKRPYQALRHYDDSPQMPSGYAGMVVLALIPPLWRAVMRSQGAGLLCGRRVPVDGRTERAAGGLLRIADAPAPCPDSSSFGQFRLAWGWLSLAISRHGKEPRDEHSAEILASGAIGIVAVVLLGGVGFWGQLRLGKALTENELSVNALRNHMEGDMMHDALRADVLAAFVVQPGDGAAAEQVREDLQEHSQWFRKVVEQNQGCLSTTPSTRRWSSCGPT